MRTRKFWLTWFVDGNTRLRTEEGYSVGGRHIPTFQGIVTYIGELFQGSWAEVQKIELMPVPRSGERTYEVTAYPIVPDSF